MFNQTVRGRYCLRCASRQVVSGHMGESARFYPLRSALRSLLGKPVFLAEQHSHACLACGLTWNEVNPDDLRKNLRDYGRSPHSTGVMQAIQPDAASAVDLKL